MWFTCYPKYCFETRKVHNVFAGSNYVHQHFEQQLEIQALMYIPIDMDDNLDENMIAHVF